MLWLKSSFPTSLGMDLPITRRRSLSTTIQEIREMRIGEILIEMGWLMPSQLEKALEKQKQADMRGEPHVPLGKVLVESGAIGVEVLLLALAEQRSQRRKQAD